MLNIVRVYAAGVIGAIRAMKAAAFTIIAIAAAIAAAPFHPQSRMVRYTLVPHGPRRTAKTPNLTTSLMLRAEEVIE